MKKLTIPSELNWLIGLFFIAFSACTMEKSNFGISMVTAPAYLIFRKVSLLYGSFTFGTAEFLTQILVLALMVLILRRFRIAYLFCFVTAAVYGLMVDFWYPLISTIQASSVPFRLFLFVIGELAGCAGVTAVLHSYVPPQSYDSFVKYVSAHLHISLGKFKTGYDLTSLAIGIVFSFLFFGFGHFIGIRWGTIAAAAVNGTIIGLMSRGFERVFTCRDLFPLRKYCED